METLGQHKKKEKHSSFKGENLKDILSFIVSGLFSVYYVKTIPTLLSKKWNYVLGRVRHALYHSSFKFQPLNTREKRRITKKAHEVVLSHRLIAIFLTLCFTNSLVPYNWLYANNNAPNAPEAGAFEPVDVPDMVNLKTGDMTYALPIINIPGIEGGYPLALSYHSGISTDQESSWVGLGWSLNPGAIARNINRLPDDWSESKVYDYYWNEGETYTQQTVDVMIPLPSGTTIGLGYSWGNLRGNSGSVSIGFGGLNLKVGTAGIDVGYGAGMFSGGIGLGPNGLTINAGLRTTNGNLDISRGLSYNTNSGFSGGTNLSFSANSGGLSMRGSVGMTTQGALTYSTGAQLNTYKNENGSIKHTGEYNVGSSGAIFTSTLKQDDITIETSDFTIPLFVINYTKEKVRVYVDESKKQHSTGSLYKNLYSIHLKKISYCMAWAEEAWNNSSQHPNQPVEYFFSECMEDPFSKGFEYYSKVDMYEGHSYSGLVAMEFDNYSVSGQGISGQMFPKINGNPNLAPADSGDLQDTELTYYAINDLVDRTTKVPFSFKTDVSQKSSINPVKFVDNASATYLKDFIQNPTNIVTGNEKGGKYIEYYTYDEVEGDPSLLMPEGFVKPSGVDGHAIAGFSVTSEDGITYHYMLPVYNHLYKARKILDKSNPRRNYSETTKPAYATHWLLTGITGPDYYDWNGDHRLNPDDHGYWVGFDYGKWSTGMVWRNPTDLSEEHEATAFSYLWGIKDLYYLDKISTNTHTALFIKDVRHDAKGIPMPFTDKDSQFDRTLPVQKQLLLDKIVLVKNETAQNVSKQNAQNLLLGQTFNFFDPRSGEDHVLELSMQNNVLDIKDIGVDQSLIDNALSVVQFEYDYALANNSPNTDSGGKLTLKRVYANGEGGANLVPPYEFFYANNPDWEYDIYNVWGYFHENPAAWSLTGVKLPVGATMGIEYEEDQYESLSAHDDTDYGWLDLKPLSYHPYENSLTVRADLGSYDIEVGEKVDMSYTLYDYKCGNTYIDVVCDPGKCILKKEVTFNGTAVLESINYINGVRQGEFVADISSNYEYNQRYEPEGTSCDDYYREGAGFRAYYKYKTSGLRVSSVSISDNINTWRTTYSYKMGNVPYEPVYDHNVRNQFFLASPIVLYPEVTVSRYDASGERTLYSTYYFTTHRSEGCKEDKGCTRVSVTSEGEVWENRLGYDRVYAKRTTVQDFQSQAGLLKSVVHKTDVSGVGRILSREENTYLPLDLASGFVNSESYQLYRTEDLSEKPGGVKEVQLVSTTVNHYPYVLTQTKSVSGPYSTTQRFDDLDPYTGRFLTTFTEDSKGLKIKAETVPARVKYPEMGSKGDNPANANMLDQTAATYTWSEVDRSGEYELLSVGIQTWHDQWLYRDYKGVESIAPKSIWRKHKTYTWKGSGLGLTARGTISDVAGATSFIWWDDLEPPGPSNGWLKTGEINRYNKFSAVVEQSDINGDRSSIKYSVDQSKIIAVANTAYQNFYFAGFEDYSRRSDGLSGEVNSVSNIVSSAHTGRHSMNLQGSWSAIRNSPFDADRYRISLWSSKEASIKVNGQDPDESVDAGNWRLNNYYLDLNQGQAVVVSGNGLIDDFRMCPADKVGMQAFVYDEKDHLTYIIGDNGLAEHYIYDANGGLIEVWKEVSDKEGLVGGFKKIGEYKKNYKHLN